MEEDPPGFPRRPERIGSYRILRQIGEGGMGAVYEAEQEKPRRRVALKILKPGVATPIQLKRFEREADVLGLLQHPGIAQVYDAGTADAGFGPQPYFAMELIDGKPLGEHARQRGFTVRQRLELVARVCDAVQHAHQKGIVHRDLKPGNILVVAQDDPESSTHGGSRSGSRSLHKDIAYVGQPKVLDFGLARITDSDVKTATIQTEAGQILGTVRYMSPEQVEGVSDDIDTRSDIYALGVVAFELLTGKAPHDVDGRTVYDAIRVIQEDEPQRLSSIDRSLHGDVDTIVAKALEKEKGRRYSTAGDMAADIRRFLHDEPIVARRPSTAYQIRKFAARNRVLVLGVAATFLALVAGIVATTMQSIRAVRARDEATLARDEATRSRDEAQRAAAEAKAINDFLVKDMLLGADPARAKGRRISVEEVLGNASSKVDSAFPDQPLVAASIRGTLGRIYYALGRNDQAEPHLRFAYDTFCRLAGPEDGKTLEAGHDLARTQLVRHKLDEAESLLRFELEYRERSNDPYLYTPMTPLAQVLNSKGDTSAAEEYYTNVIDMLRDREKLSEQESSSLLSASTDLANIVYRRGETDRAFSLYAESLAILEREHGELHPDVARVIGNRANLYSALHQEKEALEGYQKALEIQKAVFHADHPDIAVSLVSIGMTLRHLGRYVEAEATARQAVELRKRLFGDDAPETADAQVELASLLRALDRHEEAETLLRGANVVLLKTLGADANDVADAQFELALVLRARKDIEGALLACEESVRIRRLHAVDNPLLLITGESLLAQLHHSRKEYALAEPVYREVIERYRSFEGESMNVAIGYANLGQVLEDQKKLDEASSELARSVEIARKVLETGDPTLGFLLIAQARIERKRDRLDEASAMLDEALATLRDRLPPGHSSIASALFQLGEVRLAQDRASEAEPLLRDAVEARRKSLPEGDWMRAAAESSLGRCLVALKRYEEAEPLLVKAYSGLADSKADPELARDAARALAALYAATNAGEKATEWKARAGAN